MTVTDIDFKSGRVLVGDCVERMRQLPDASVDAIVTDPPYGLEFMGKDWDAPWKGNGTVEQVHEGTDRTHPFRDGSSRVRYGNKDMVTFQDWFTVVATEALRVLKPGGHLLAFGGTRTYHRMACAIEDAGFEIRDSIHWVYGSGFPKSLDVSKAIDKAAGAERKVVGEGRYSARRPRADVKAVNAYADGVGDYSSSLVTAPATDGARRWEGWGTALKPAHEPVVVARKPLSGTVAANVLEWGTGGMNIDGCRVGTDTIMSRGGRSGAVTGDEREGAALGMYGAHEPLNTTHTGRWPANVVFDRAAGDALDQQSGVSKSPEKVTRGGHSRGGADWSMQRQDNVPCYGDSGGASRFFTQSDFGPDDWPFVYQAKPSRKERNAGLDGLPEKAGPDGMRRNLEAGQSGGRGLDRQNHHPTVKPVALMRHLVRLVTPPGGTVLDPFLGSGTTAVAAVLEGFQWAGCEMTDEYLPIIRGRVEWAEKEAAKRAKQPKLGENA